MAMIPMDALQTGLSGKRRNWVYFFFVLAAFNLLTVCFSLILNHQLLNIQHQTVEGNLAWVDQLKLCDVLAEKAAEVNNPANRLLHSHLVAAEAARSAAAMAHFNQVFSELARQRPVQQPYFQSTYFKTDLTNIQKEFAELGANTEAIFEQARKNQWQEVADCLAGLSVDYNDVLRALDTLRAHIRADRDLFLRMELKKARELAGREWFLGGADPADGARHRGVWR